MDRLILSTLLLIGSGVSVYIAIRLIRYYYSFCALMKMGVIFAVLCCPSCVGSAQLAPSDSEPTFEDVGGNGPVLLPPEPLAKAEDTLEGIWQDWAGQEGAVYATHYLFLNGEYENGTWFLPNNTTVA